ncbi:MAG: AAA family ATPase [Dehalococcoidia bacterium]|nr:AAA family ATPase [Dehalococcoidia bacterium]
MVHPSSGRFGIPRRRRSMLPRPRLTGALHAAVGNGVTVLAAPAGFGKTSLVAAFASEVEYNVRWLTLDASCRAPEVFTEQLARALAGEAETVAPASGERAEDLRAYLGVALRRAAAASDLPLLLVIDNAHELREALESSEILGFLIDTMGDGTEVVLAGREAPPLTEVDRRVATGEAVQIERRQLAFTQEEIQTLLPEGGEREAAAIFAATDGWPAAVMAVLAGTVSVARVVAGRNSGAWERYLAAEVWAQVPVPLKEKLLRLAVPIVVTRQAGEGLLGKEGWREAHGWLERHDFLCEQLAGGGLRLHPLLREFLAGVFAEDDPAGFAAAARSVSATLERQGQVADAIEVALEAKDVETLVGLMQRQSQGLIYQGAYALLRRLYEALPREELEERPLLRAMHARVLAHTGRAGEALSAAEAYLEDEEVRGEARVHALLAKHRALRLLSRREEMPAIFSEARGLALAAEGSKALLAELTYQEAHYELGVNADFTRAEILLKEALRGLGGGRIAAMELLVRSTLGQLLAMRGDGPASVTELARAAEGWRQLGGSSNLCWVLNNLGMAHISVGDFEGAVGVLGEAQREGLTCENMRNYAYATASLADAEMARGRYEQARVCYEEAIRVCSQEAPDETLASLSIAGLAGAFAGLGDLQQADYFSERSLWIAEALGNPFEVGMCVLQHAAVLSAAGDHNGSVGETVKAIELFETIAAGAPLRLAWYRLGLFHFRANRRGEAHEALRSLAPLIREPWMIGALLPAVREHPMFAQWAASRDVLGPAFRDLLQRHAFGEDEGEEEQPGRLPRVVARSLGATQVSVGQREVPDEAWASVRAKEMFFMFLWKRAGLRKEEAVEQLYPEQDAEKCNSLFHSNLYRVRKALYPESIVRRDGAYMLNPEGTFEWDVERFEETVGEAAKLPAGSDERARLYREALACYGGPFAEAFYSEWAETVRQRTSERVQGALSTLAGYHAGRGEYEEAAGCMERLLQVSLYNEEAAYRLARYRAQGGRAAAALAFLDDYGSGYAREFGAVLPRRFRELRARIAAGMAV